MEEDLSAYLLADDFAKLTSHSFFLTGKAGTGKTTFLKRLKQECDKQIAVVAPTGVAAINAEGVTMHSFFLLPFTPFVPTAEGKRNLLSKQRMSGRKRELLRELELLVIDEISMVRSDTLDAVDTILRHYRYRPNEAFGGVQVIFIGDLYQLSPVVKDEEWQLLSQYYETPYFFHSKVIQHAPPTYLELDHIFRQSDASFIGLLNEIRDNRLSPEGRRLLDSRYQPTLKGIDQSKYITLTTHNNKANLLNAEEMQKIKEPIFRFSAKVTGDFPERNFPNEEVLELKKGARVMFIANDKESPRRYYNGKIGTISSMSDQEILIHCDDADEDIPVSYETWENISYSVNSETKQIEERVLGTYTQYPLRLAWAITIHKSQGLTFDRVIIDLERAFASGQVYVALSRCRSLDGIILSSPVHPASLLVDNRVLDYTRRRLPADELKQRLQVQKDIYQCEVLVSLFDFKMVAGELRRLFAFVKENESSFNEETIPFIQAAATLLLDMQDVSERFQMQIRQLFNAEGTNRKLIERIDSAVGYYVGRIDEFEELLLQSPAVTDSRENAQEYNTTLVDCYTEVNRKKYIMEQMRADLSPENFFRLRKTYVVPSVSVNAYSAHHTAKVDTHYPELYQRLVLLRNEICGETNIPPYLVAKTSTLVEVTNFLPQDESELERISGFGKLKVRKFGRQFLEVVRAYCKENNLSSLIGSKTSVKKKSVVKKDKPDTKRVTLLLCEEGKNIEEIAVERGLTVATVERHIAFFIESGELSVSRFIPADIVSEITDMLLRKEGTTAIYEHFKGSVSYGKIRFVVAHLQKENT